MTVNPRIGYVGMTHLGICSAVASASKGFATIGFSDDAALINRLDRGELPIMEPGLDELLRDSRAHMVFTSDPASLCQCDVIYVAPDVPTDDKGNSDLAPLDGLLELALVHAGPDAVLVVLSQVPPGFTRARQRANRSLFYQVETLIFGRAVERATLPERFIVGCANTAETLPGSLATFLRAFDCPVLPMRYESAELAKIAINCCLVASVTTANTLAGICEKIGADWSEIVPTLRLDRRIGPYAYLVPGLGIAGGNLERDLATVIRLGDASGTDVGVVRAWQANSRLRRDWVLDKVHTLIASDAYDVRLGLLGLAYKENTHSTKNSPALALLAALAPYSVSAFDPVVAASSEWHPSLKGASDAISAATGADALVIMTPWPEFKTLAPAEIAKRMRGRIVIDPFACLSREACRAAGLSHHTLGVGAE